MKIRVAFIIDFIYASTGGTENQLLALLRGLDRQRYEPHLISLRKTPWLEDHGSGLNVSLKCFEMHRLRSRATPSQAVALVRHLRRVRPDIVLTFFTLSNIVGVLAARLAGCHEIWGTRRDCGVWYNNAFRGDLHFLKFADRFVQGIVTNANAVKELLVKVEGVAAGKIRVIYNGIDATGFEVRTADRSSSRRALGIAGDGPVVGIVAGLRPMKHHETFLLAAREVLRRRTDTRFVLLGDGPLRSRLEERARELGISTNLVFAGWRADVRDCLAAFDVGVNCSANEGLSNAIMEYMAGGVPCVVSKAGGNAELVEDGINGFLYPLDEHEVLAERICRLLDEKHLRERFARSAREKIHARFGFDTMIEEYHALFAGARTVQAASRE